MKMLSLNIKIVLGITLLSLLGACKSYDNIGLGPMIKGNTPSSASKKCSYTPAGDTCEIFFRDHQGQNLRANSIRDKIDNQLLKIKIFDTWTGLKQKVGYFPYKLYLLTISPIVVMVTPASPPTNDYCHNQYLTSKLIFPVCYQYLESPKVMPGSFIFSTDVLNKLFYIPDDAEKFEVSIKDTKLELAKSGKEWIVVRY